MLRAGFQRFIVDPGVRQAYFPDTASKLYTDQVWMEDASDLAARNLYTMFRSFLACMCSVSATWTKCCLWE